NSSSPGEGDETMTGRPRKCKSAPSPPEAEEGRTQARSASEGTASTQARSASEGTASLLACASDLCCLTLSRIENTSLLPNHLDQYRLGPMAVELAVENLLPWAEVEFPFRDGDDNLPAHDLPLQVGVGVVLTGAIVVVVVGIGVERGQLFQPDAEVVV